MNKTFELGIYSAQKTIFEGQVISLVVPAEYGYLGVLAAHEPLAARLTKGKITFRDISGESKVIENSSTGFLQVNQNQACILL